jgi:hypothetical protein
LAPPLARPFCRHLPHRRRNPLPSSQIHPPTRLRPALTLGHPNHPDRPFFSPQSHPHPHRRCPSRNGRAQNLPDPVRSSPSRNSPLHLARIRLRQRPDPQQARLRNPARVPQIPPRLLPRPRHPHLGRHRRLAQYRPHSRPNRPPRPPLQKPHRPLLR